METTMMAQGDALRLAASGAPASNTLCLMAIAVVCALAGSVRAEPAAVDSSNTLTIQQLIADAQKDNPEILAAREKWEAQRDLIPAAKTWKDPMIGPEFWQIPDGDAPTPGNSQMRMYTIDQEIPFPGKLSAEGKAQTHMALLAEHEYEATALKVFREVADAYYSLWFLEQAVSFQSDHAGLWESYSQSAERLFAAGKVSERDVLRAQMEGEKAALRADNLKEEMPAALAALNALLNQPPDRALSPQAPPAPGPGPDASALNARTLENNKDVLTMQHHVTHEDFLLQKAKLGYLPDFDLGWARMEQSNGFEGYNAQILLKIPLYFWKQRAQVKAAQAGREQAEAEYADAKNKAQAQLRSAVAAVRNAARTESVYKESVLPRAQEALKVSQAAYLGERGNFLDLLDSEQSLISEELDYAAAQADYGKALAALNEVVGGPEQPMAGMGGE